VDVDDDGFVTAIFTNGLTRRIYQIPLATFGNVDGLLPEHGGVFRLGPGAGALSMRGAGIGGAGNIKSRALESSTVDLAEEFSNLIMTQRAYSASSKIITTADEMLDELIRLKR
jgi:flagellar hook protein FlgE